MQQFWKRAAVPGAVFGVMLSASAAMAQEATPEELLALAEQGDLTAQVDVCAGYLIGQAGFAQDAAKAVPYCRRAAESGIAASQNIMGQIYHKGWGVEPDYAQALHWYQLSAAQGDAQSQVYLGNFHYNGLGGLAVDHAEAAKYYRLAAEQGLAQAQANLAVLYERGEGVAMDMGEAKRLFRLAAEAGDTIAAANLARLENQ